MIPQASEEVTDFDTEVELQPSKTYMLHPESGIIAGYTDMLSAMEQAVYKILNTERYRFLIYSWNYGIELDELLGEEIEYVLPEFERRITEALIQDERIKAVDGFEYEINGNAVYATFTVHTVFGEVESESEVNY